MSESREQRRARELAALRAVHPPVPRTTPKLERVIEIKLRRDTTKTRGPVGACLLWSAEWTLRGTTLGIERSDENIAALIENILEDARLLAEHYAVRLEWILSGDLRTGGVLAASGVTLPDFVPGPCFGRVVTLVA
ncbi:hypothetical protein ACFQ05_42080 [Amycolatopsis umgeniensis]|uniref:Uncharacterized protein n=1 Tax=Amycolatopsis umgeniensis TaxID=336628 RepID=A0A841AR49_9PSEU|nr:hypothetical protein [Amycolatopsis umgeniensis]MBB5851299.1 hypothetical protein [Amycolatopsis umgeniensis]